jgi:predicted CopG family antitoxin
MPRRIRHSLTLAADVWAKLVAWAAAEGRSVSNLIERLVHAEAKRRGE